MQLAEMTTMQLNQLNIPNPEPVKEITKSAWRSSDGQYVILLVEFDAFTVDGGRRTDEQIRFLRVYATDERGIPMPLYVELLCAEGAEALVLAYLGQLLDDQPSRLGLTIRLNELWNGASRLDPVGERFYITIPGFAQYKTKGNHGTGKD